MSPFNPNTGEFEGEPNQQPDMSTGKEMFTQEGRKVIMLENGTIFDPSKGEWVSDIDPTTLKEDNK